MSPTRKSATSSTASKEAPVFETWMAERSEDELEQYNGLLAQFSHSPLPRTAALLAFFEIDPNRVPSNNGFYSNGYITFRKKVEGDEMTVTGYRDDAPMLHDYPEGLTFELIESALIRDNWGI